MLSYFKWAFLFTLIGFITAFIWGVSTTGSLGGAVQFLFVCVVLSILEISLSFDNAIVNANKLKTMSELWRKRFLTWGIIIAVFGMRLVFPVLIVMIAAEIGPASAINLSINDPQKYSEIIKDAHLSISAFGSSFLMLVALSYFMDVNKEVDWLGAPERALRKCASIQGLEVTFVLASALLFSFFFESDERSDFIFSSLIGILIFMFVQLLSQLLEKKDLEFDLARNGLSGFIYLEILDASFSFDGVIGAFALTQNLFLILIGLGIGAFYVRSMTIMLLERGTLNEYCYLENGAFWSILVLAFLMALQSFLHIPEAATGLLSVSFIALAFNASIRKKRET